MKTLLLDLWESFKGGFIQSFRDMEEAALWTVDFVDGVVGICDIDDD